MPITNTTGPITTREDLHRYLQIALQIEHATIPPYLTAMYSIKIPDRVNDPNRPASLDDEKKNPNHRAYNIIRAVAVEEMLHLTLAANVLNAVGGAPDLLRPGFVPNYPAYLPTGECDFEVGLHKFSEKTIDTFLNIERPTQPEVGKSTVEIHNVAYVEHKYLKEGREKGRGLLPHFFASSEQNLEEPLHFWSIGDFYMAIRNGIEYLAGQMGEEVLFCGDQERQITPEYYYSGGGDVVTVVDKKTAFEALDLISGQGEGYGGNIYDSAGELSHYYRFQQIKLRQYYREAGDSANNPQGNKFEIDWDDVYPIRANLKIADFPANCGLQQEALAFNHQYKEFLGEINTALNGKPGKLMHAFAGMFRIKAAVLKLIKQELPSGNRHASPTFEIN